jgi:hypothetical protein
MLLVVLACPRVLADEPSVTPTSMVHIGEVDERFQSFNVEMVEVTGDVSGNRTARTCRVPARTSLRIVHRSIWLRPVYENSLLRWRRLMYASVGPGQTQPTSQIPTPRHRRLLPDSMAF